MRDSSRIRALQNTKNRIINLTTAFIVAVTGMSGALPLFLSQKAMAVSTSYTSAPLTSTELSGWIADRSTPSGGYGSIANYYGKTNVAELSVTAASANPVNFYKTEGIKRSLPDSDSLKASLYVDGDWQSKGVRAGLWGTMEDGSNAVSAYPIIEFSTLRDTTYGDSSTGWRVWDGVDGGWTNLSTPYAWNNWYDLEISLNNITGQVAFTINGSEVLTLDDAYSDHIGEVILNSYNSGANNYSVHWAELAYGTFDTASAPNDVYVDDDFAGQAFDANGHMMGYDAFSTIQQAIAGVAVGGTVHVAAGTYTENVNVTKQVTVQGAGASSTTIVGTNGNTTPLTFSAHNATVDGFTITHNYTPSELSSWNFNNNGVTFGQTMTGNTLSNSTVTLNRNGVYINNAQNNKLIGNTITNNRTGINMTNTTNGTQIKNNVISDNWTVGLVMYSSGLTGNLSTLTVTGNTFDKNWYTEVLVKDAGLYSGTLDVTGNTFTDSPVTFSTSSSSTLNEPGFAAQHPVVLGGAATKPAQEYPTLRIYNSPAVTLMYTSPNLDVNGNEVTLTNGDNVVTMPTDTVITPSDPSWNGVVQPPTVVNTTVSLPSGTTQGVAIEVGSSTVSLTFDQAARLLMKNQAGKRVGYQTPGGTFTEITTVCGADDQATVDAQLSALHVNECKINVGTDLVVWTKHFTTFVTFSNVVPVVGSTTTASTTNRVASVSSAATAASETAASVLGIASGTASDATKTPSTTNKDTDKKDDSSAFLGLGWYWLIVLAAVAALGYLVLVRRADRD